MTIIVPAVLGGLAITVMALVSLAAARKRPGGYATAEAQARILIHHINDDRCTGCDACVAVCPTNVLDLVENKSRVLRFQDCIQCEACMWACPTEALVMHLEGTEPPPLKVPELDENFQTAVPGQYLIGEVAGKPLVKNAANLGRAVVEHMLKSGLEPGRLASKRTEGSDASKVSCVDVAIVGSGPGGLSAALTCIQRGLSYVLLEKEHLIASTIARYPKGKLVMAEPYEVPNKSLLPVFDSSKEEIIPVWEEMMERTGLKIQLGATVEEVSRRGDGVFDVRTASGAYRAQRVVLAIGTRGKPRTLSVAGENLPKVHSLLEDPDDHRGQSVLVVGGGDSAVEAALALADAGAKVILSYRGRGFSRAQPKNKQAIESYAAQKRIKVKYQSNIVQFDSDTVTIALADGSQKRYPNHAAFILIGADPPVKWLAKLGVHFVERPHAYELGRTDQVVERFTADAVECPRDAASAAAMVLGRAAPARARAPMPAPAEAPGTAVSGPRKWLRAATDLFTSARQLEGPMPLSEFAKRNKQRHPGHGRRDELEAGERTRVLRMLRDEGGRLADEDSRVELDRASGAHAAPVHLTPSPEPRIERIHGSPRLTTNEVQAKQAPRQAVIVGLARAMAKGPATGVRRKRPTEPQPLAIAQPVKKFVEAATVQAQPSALDELLQQSAPPRRRPVATPVQPPPAPAASKRPSIEFGEEATRAADFDPAAIMARADDTGSLEVHPSFFEHVELDDDAELGHGVLLIDEDHRGGATETMSPRDLARFEARLREARMRQAPRSAYSAQTRAMELGRASSLSDIEWDLD